MSDANDGCSFFVMLFKINNKYAKNPNVKTKLDKIYVCISYWHRRETKSKKNFFSLLSFLYYESNYYFSQVL